MTIAQAIERIDGMRYVVEGLDVRSAPGRHALMSLKTTADPAMLSAELDRVAMVAELIADPARRPAVEMIGLRLSQVKDVRRSASRLGQGKTADEIELFEIKAFALLCGQIGGYVAEAGIAGVDIPDLEGAVALLDPDGRRIPHFAIYDAYDSELAGVRRRLREVRNADSRDDADLEKLYDRNAELEERVRRDLTEKLAPYAADIGRAADRVAALDLLLAKAWQAVEMNFCKPGISDDRTVYEGLFNPGVADALNSRGQTFQPVDITVEPRSTLITGANMGGKTVVLKSVALAQAMFQLGMFVPASRAGIVPVDEIFILAGDGQDARGGLSSFAWEMERLAGAVSSIAAGRRILFLADEPARTTNPREGRAIVGALLEYLNDNGVLSLVTSHYDGLKSAGRQLRVRGLDGIAEGAAFSDAALNDMMDYSLVEWHGSEAPHEAIRVARMLGGNDELIERAEKLLGE